MEKPPQVVVEKSEPEKERKERRNLWSRLGVIALAGSMVAACTDMENRGKVKLEPSGENPSVAWDVISPKDAEGNTTAHILRAEVTTGEKKYLVDLDLGPIHAGISQMMDNPVIPAEGYPVSGGEDPKAATWIALDDRGNGETVTFTPAIESNEPVLVVSLKKYRDGHVVKDRDIVEHPDLIKR